MKDNFHELVIQQYFSAGKRLHHYAKRLSELPKGSVQTKKKDGKEYYYISYREGEKVHTDYLGSSLQQKRDAEQTLKERETVEAKWKEAKDEREACEHALKYKNWRSDTAYDFSLYYGSILVADVMCSDADVRLKRYELSPGMQLFYSDSMNRMEIGEVLASRCWDENRQNLDHYLDKLGLDQYDPFQICRKTHGIMLQDLFWIRYPGESFDGMKVLRRKGLV